MMTRCCDIVWPLILFKGADSAKDAVQHWFKLELAEQCELFIGSWFKYVELRFAFHAFFSLVLSGPTDVPFVLCCRYVYLVIFYIFQTSTLWSYGAVFSETAAAIVSPAFVRISWFAHNDCRYCPQTLTPFTITTRQAWVT